MPTDDADQHRKGQARSHQQERRRDALQHQPGTGRPPKKLKPQLPTRRFDGPLEVLHVGGLIEPEDHLDALDVLRRHRRVQRVDRERTAGRELHQRKADDRDPEDQDRSTGQAVRE